MPPEYYELFPDGVKLEAEWFHRTGIYPIHGLIVIKEQFLTDHPWLAKSLFAGFVESKRQYLEALKSGALSGADDKKYREFMPIVADDPLPYGVKANLPSIEAMITYAVQQELMPRRLPIDKLFVDPSE